MTKKCQINAEDFGLPEYESPPLPDTLSDDEKLMIQFMTDDDYMRLKARLDQIDQRIIDGKSGTV